MKSSMKQLENLDFIMKFQSDSTVNKFLKPFSIQDWISIQRPPIESYISPEALYNLLNDN